MTHNKKIKLVSGQRGNLQENRPTWNRHIYNADHKNAAEEQLGKSCLKKARSAAGDKKMEFIKDQEKALMKIYKFVTDFLIPNATLSSLVDLCIKILGVLIYRSIPLTC